MYSKYAISVPVEVVSTVTIVLLTRLKNSKYMNLLNLAITAM